LPHQQAQGPRLAGGTKTQGVSTMRDLTFNEIDEQLAEQLPSRELMGSSGCRSSCCSQPSNTYNQGSFDGNGNGNGNKGLIVIAGNGNGNFNGLNNVGGVL
jgi:hypothetical protein